MTRRYPAYKDSGVEWLGDVPGHWSSKPFWALFRRTKRTGHSGEELLSVYRDYGVVPKSSRDDNFNKPSDDLDAYQLVESGDLAINKMKAWQGSVAISNYRGIVSPAYFIYSPVHSESARFLHYLLRSGEYTSAYTAISSGVRPNQWDLDPQLHSRLPVLLPPLPEQTAIAVFLERETAKIDALVAEQRRLIDLLREKRQAVISHAVTKGLNPNAPLKPSGIDWLGDVPEGWEVVPLKYLVSHVVDCLHTTPTYDGDLQYPAIRTADVDRGVLLLDQARLVSEEIYLERIQRLKPEAGDVLYSREGERLGMAALVPEGVDLCLGQRMMMFRTLGGNAPDYLMWALNSEPIYQQVMEKNIGATSPHANIGDVVNFRLPRPSIEEQRRIGKFLSTVTTELDTLTAIAETAIALLQERRAALISAAVSGKIDVRHLSPAATEAA